MVTFMVDSEALHHYVKSLLIPYRLWLNWLPRDDLVVESITSIDLSSTLVEPMFVPLFALTRFPFRATNVTKLVPTPTPIDIESVMSE